MEQQTLDFLDKLKQEKAKINKKYRLIVIYSIGILETFFKADCETIEEAQNEYKDFTKRVKFPIIHTEIIEI